MYFWINYFFSLFFVMKLFCWTDSLDCLFWIYNTKKIWKQFIQTRVLKIRDTLKGTSWLFCPGVQNPADIVTRGSYLKDDVLRRYLVGGNSVSVIVSGRLASTKNLENYKSNESRCLPGLSNSGILFIQAWRIYLVSKSIILLKNWLQLRHLCWDLLTI